ncbi:carbon-nitrogen hydrolase family protein [Sporosalibacterium faouarense]|uniref:carbon-nitrogen hydrolase family protein n=1 Tax=Sporosalibacterium faouarense TaxID=516123 RepID=UPI00141C823B|nr:carbon-nitrogen hydrolase family protein [Sporosalibacterium faouarense]MTI49612.1 carbon-nitrogen hydrolase family protein [Bacillota bacterium]
MSVIKVGICQMIVEDDKEVNINKAEKHIRKAVKEGAELIVLPEMFNCPYENSFFPKFAEEYPNGKTIAFLSDMARENKIYLVGGSIPERDSQGNIYNTSFTFDPNGNMIGKHRKMHLFDIDIPNGITFKESDTLSSGNDITVFDTELGRVGVAICYDIRFPELMRKMVLQGAKMIIIPAAFNMTTGPAHWEMLFRMRALDNQVYMLGCAPARNKHASYTSYGNSIITEPWGNIVERLDESEGVIIQSIDLNRINKIRQELPLLKHRRKDIYN